MSPAPPLAPLPKGDLAQVLARVLIQIALARQSAPARERSA